MFNYTSGGRVVAGSNPVTPTFNDERNSLIFKRLSFSEIALLCFFTALIVHDFKKKTTFVCTMFVRTNRKHHGNT